MNRILEAMLRRSRAMEDVDKIRYIHRQIKELEVIEKNAEAKVRAAQKLLWDAAADARTERDAADREFEAAQKEARK